MSRSLTELVTSAWGKTREQLPYLPRALGLAWGAARQWTMLWAVLLLVQGLLPVATVYLSRVLVNSLVAAYRTGADWQSVRPALGWAAAMGLVLLLGEALRSASGLVRSAQSELVHDHIVALIHNKSIAADMGFYDSPDFYDRLHRATRDASNRPLALLETLGTLLQNTITLAAMGAVLLPFGWWVPATLLGTTLPALAVVLHWAYRQHEWRVRQTVKERRTRYYDWLMTSPEGAAELRLLDLGKHFQELYRTLRRQLHAERLQLAWKQSGAELGAGVLALGLTGATLGWMAWKAVRGLLTPGDLALFYQAYNQGLQLTRTLLDKVGVLYANLLYLGNLFEYLEMEPQVADAAQPMVAAETLKQSIRFNRVTFTYPGNQRAALEDFSLEIPAGQIAAVVGSNGAGKSTLIKLMCRFYDPQEGCIELDGTDLRQLSLESLRRRITVLFQQPMHYQETVRENIALGDLRAAGDRDAIVEAAQAAGADAVIAHLPEGYDNQLGRWFAKGAELSVGEWQRLALARAFYRRAPILVLDEPTSAMDPWAESDWLERFRRLAAGRTSVIITHRLTTAAFADVIHVMAEGQIVESGAHQELLARGGDYAKAWLAQTQR
jgi:ATP-binding cassette subfamily B protein